MTELEKFLINAFVDKCPLDALNERFGTDDNCCKGDRFSCRRDDEARMQCWKGFKDSLMEVESI